MPLGPRSWLSLNNNRASHLKGQYARPWILDPQVDKTRTTLLEHVLSLLCTKPTLQSFIPIITSAMPDDVKADGKNLSKPAHALTREIIVDELQANEEDGLTLAEARSRLETYGRNELDDGPGVQPVKILLRQLANAMMLVRLFSIWDPEFRSGSAANG